MSSTGRGAKRREADNYATPEWVTRAILPFLPLSGLLMEPAVGEGALQRVVDEWLESSGAAHPEWYALDIRKIEPGATWKGYRRCSFLDWKPLVEARPQLIITNPPYTLALEFVAHALDVVAHGGTVAMLLRLNWLGSQRRAEFHRRHPSDVYILPKRPSFTGGGTDSCEYAWFVWGPGRGGRWQILDVEAPARHRGHSVRRGAA